MPEVYKVVRVDASGRRWSAVTGQYLPELSVEYEPGEQAYPVQGKLFAFDTPENARAFKGSGWVDSEVWRARAGSAHPVTTKMVNISCRFKQRLLDWWRGKAFGYTDQTPPTGTVACDYIELIDRVE